MMDATLAYDTLQDLLHARALARTGVAVGGEHGPTLDELDELVAHAREAWVGSAVTEIASLRAQVSGPQRG
jgi:hypothetical protein